MLKSSVSNVPNSSISPATITLDPASAVSTVSNTIGRSPAMATNASTTAMTTPLSTISHDQLTPSATIRLVPSTNPIPIMPMTTDTS